MGTTSLIILRGGQPPPLEKTPKLMNTPPDQAKYAPFARYHTKTSLETPFLPSSLYFSYHPVPFKAS